MHFLFVPSLSAFVPYPPKMRAQTLIDKTFGSLRQIHHCRIKTFQLSFYPQNSKKIFTSGKFDNCSVFILQTMTQLTVTITYVHANFLKHVTNLLLKVIVPNRYWLLQPSPACPSSSIEHFPNTEAHSS